MVTRKRLPIQQNLTFRLRRLVETRQQQVQIHSQSAHSRDLLRRGAHNLTHRAGSLVREQLPLLQGRVLQVREMATYRNRRPRIELSLHVPRRRSGLQAQRVSAEVDAWFWREAWAMLAVIDGC